MIIRALIAIFLFILIDMYLFDGVRTLTKGLSESQERTAHLLYWSFSVVTVLLLIALFVSNLESWPKWLKVYSISFLSILVMSKLVVLVFLFIDDSGRLIRYAYQFFGAKVNSDVGAAVNPNISISRSEFLVKAGLLVASIPFISLLYGMAHGASNLSIKRKKIHLPNLPGSFDGLKVLQISDLHTGSFVNDKIIRSAVDMINEEEADLIFFTGDLVNNLADEVIPYVPLLKELKAKHGVFSITGNHDYGDYSRWDSKEAKKENFEKLIKAHKDMGWRLLLDEHEHIEKDGEKITVIGVQNWSANLRFPKYGSLSKATADMDVSPVNILLSHDPSHWRGEILECFKHIDLTLSGHTHGAQFGVDIPGIKWSPVKYFYKEWSGLYEHANQYLYVNRGLGFLGYPGRVGMMPEITVLELHQNQV